MLLPNWLRQRAQTLPDHIALVTAHDSITFAELDRRVDRIARQLSSAGIKTDDRIALLMRNSIAFAEIVHAVARLGAVIVPPNLPLTTADPASPLCAVRSAFLL